MEPPTSADIRFAISPQVHHQELNALFDAAWGVAARDFRPVLERSLAYVCAFDGDRLVGFVNLAWDGGVHGFILDTTVHPEYQRQGIGKRLVLEAALVARQHGLEWVHVDYEPHLEDFYRQCGFKPTLAGLIRLDQVGP